MSTTPGVAAIQWQSDGLHLRLYYQQADGFIYEGAWDQGSGWNSGNNRLFQAKIGTPLAAIVFAVSRPQIRLYYLDNANVIQEYSFDRTWTKGATLPSTDVSPLTSLAAITWGSNTQIRVYYQRADTSIQELAYSSSWSVGNHFRSTVGDPGSSLSAVLINPTPSIRVYYQDRELTLRELAWTTEWSESTINVSPPPQAGIAAITWPNAHVRVYFPDQNENVRELSYNPSTSWIIPPTQPTSATTSPQAPLAAIQWGTGPVNIRVYFQASAQNNITEMTFNGSTWSYGTLPF